MNETTDTMEAPERTTDATVSRPRIRFGAIAWGLIVCGTAWLVLLTVSNPKARADFGDWLGNLNPGTITLIAILAVGGFILLQGALGLIRRAQKPRLS